MRLVVVGGVAAGLAAASRARRLDESLEILVLEKSPYISYGACGLPYHVEGRVRSLDQLRVYTKEYFARERRIEVRTEAEVTRVSAARREATVGASERIPFDRLILTTGAIRDRCCVLGGNDPNVFTIDTWGDAERLQRFLSEQRPKRAMVLGAGYIGLAAVEMLRARGLDVDLFEASPEILGRACPWLTKLVAAHLEKFHVRVHLGQPVMRIPACDVAILTCGLRPNTDLALDAGIELGRTGAVAVSERMETNLTQVYAAGDCCETRHLVSGRHVWFPLGTTANKMGRAAGATAAGFPERFHGIVGTSIVRVCGLGVATTGLSQPLARQEGFDAVSTAVEGLDRARYFRGRPVHVRLCADKRSGRLLGGAVVGEYGVEGRINVIATALSQRMLVEDFANLDLAYAPPYATVWDPVLVAAQQLAKLLH
ncbi:MAG: FAD-dependent oxidoreductase [Acidobacteria bacterium]|nr:FAD-dependent oxidoreductase [Acidobacteriota bacterium]